MSLDTTVGGPSADSYQSVDDVNDYLEGRFTATDLATWDALDESEQELRLRVAATIINTMSFRGAKACRNQSLEFPRWWRWDDNYPSYEDDYLDYADIPTTVAPTVPQEVKWAQSELAYQVVHSGILSVDVLAFPEREIKSFGLGGSLSIEFVGGLLNRTQFAKARISSTDIIELYLSRWIRSVNGGVV